MFITGLLLYNYHIVILLDIINDVK